MDQYGAVILYDKIVVSIHIVAQGFTKRSSAVYGKEQWSGLHGTAPVGRHGAVRVSSFSDPICSYTNFLFNVLLIY